MRRAFKNVVAWGVMLSVGACTTWAVTSEFDSTPPVDFESCAIPDPGTVGGQAVVECQVWRRRQCEVTAEQTLVYGSGIRYTIPPYRVFPTRPLGHADIKYAFPVPEDAVAGPARYIVVRRYVCTVLQNLWPIRLSPMKLAFTIREPTP